MLLENMCSLGDVIETLTDYHANGSYEKLKENVVLQDSEEYAVMIRTTNFEKNDFKNALIYIDESAYNFLRKSKVYADDLIMNKIANAGACYFMPKINKPVSLGMNLFLIRINKEKAIPYFIYAYLKKNESYVKSFASGSTTKTITKNDVRKLNIYLPPLPEQQKIAKVLSTWDKAIEKLESLILAKKTRKKALMQQLLTEKKRFDGFDKEWEYISINKAFSVITDYVASGSFASLKENVSVFDNENYAHYVRQTDLAAKFSNKRLKYVDEKSYSFLKKSNLFEGDILFTNIGDLGKVFYMPQLEKPATVAPNLIVLRSSEKFDSKYIFYLLSSNIGQKAINRIKSGTGLPKINKTEFKSMSFFFPPIGEQQKIASVLSISDKEIEINQQELDTLKQQKKGLMQQLLTGKKRVKLDATEIRV